MTDAMISRRYEVAAGTNENGDFEVYTCEVWYDSERKRNYDYSNWVSCHDTQELAEENAGLMNNGCFYWKQNGQESANPLIYGNTPKRMTLYHSLNNINYGGIIYNKLKDCWFYAITDTEITGNRDTVQQAKAAVMGFYDKD
jgi:hypothetical protein